MKPLNVKISAFGPYKNEINIDFKKLGESGIFLITGDTGAGKTTIFDAISYALFGEVSGSNRQVSTIRSDFANEETETFVELEFIHKNKTYKIKRIPSYERAKKRGEGVIKTNSDCYLEYEDIVISGTKNVDSKIEEILGINAKQFKQIAMLAQGEFLKILFAESKDRTEIFRRIFDTDIYNQISKKLMDKTRIAKGELEQLKDFFVINSSNIMWSIEDVENFENISTKDVNELLIEEILEKLKKQIEIDKTEYKKYNVEIKNIEKEIEKLSEEIRIKQEQNNQIDLFDKLEKQKNELIKKEVEIKDKEEILKKNQDVLNKILPIEKRVKEINIEIKEKEKSIQTLKETIEKSEDKEKQSKTILETLDKMKFMLQNYDDLSLKKIELEKILQSLNEIIKEIENKNKAEEKSKKLEIELEKIVKELSEKEIAFYREQAGILAENLKENQPCPVCGSINHPCLAEKSESVLTKDQLDKLKDDKEKSNKIFIEAVNKVTEITSKIKTLKNGLNVDIIKDEINMNFDNMQDNNENSVLNNYKKVIKEKCEKIDEDINNVYGNINKIYNQFTNKKLQIIEFKYDDFKNEISSKIQEEREQLLKNKTKLEENQKQFNILKQKQDNIHIEYKNTLKELGFENEEIYKKFVLTEKQANNIKNEIEQYKKDVTINNTRIEEIKKNIKDFNKIDLADKNKELVEKQNILKQTRNLLMEQNTSLTNNEKILKDLSKNSVDLKIKINKFMLLEDLSKTANGTIYGKRRIEFEQFVQASYFELVISEANKRLAKMTDNRFVLARKESSDKVSDKIGLELEVIDNYSGKKRDVKSLSGGESFKAALSLALGLSDVIQSYSGGIVVDTIFIDEGFGSLDDESREHAINTLNQLTDNNKLIGIISHVTELKERIDKKIIISKSQAGSQIKMEI